MKKTAMQQHIQDLEKVKKILLKQQEGLLAENIDACILNARAKLETERNNIIEAFKSARNIQDSDECSITYDFMDGTEYYQTTFNH